MDRRNQRVAIVDDHDILRAGIKALLEDVPSTEVIAEAGNGDDAVEIVKDLTPDVVIMDVAMPGKDGIEATREIAQLNLGSRILALSMHADRHFISQMFNAGAAGYILKECAMEELGFALSSIRKYGYYVSPSVIEIVIERYIKTFEPDESLLNQTTLSWREREVLQLIADGWSTAAIAKNFNLSVKTVETHRKHVMDKLNIHSIASLTKFAIRCGLTNVD